MRHLYPLCQRLVTTDVPVVIEGETGTGKEQLPAASDDAMTAVLGLDLPLAEARSRVVARFEQRYPSDCWPGTAATAARRQRRGDRRGRG